MTTHAINDPFALLGLASDADDATVRAAYHDRIRAGTADARINAAYASVRTAGDRERLRFTSLTTFIAQPPTAVAVTTSSFLEPAQREAVVRECASLSDWELGDA